MTAGRARLAEEIVGRQDAKFARQIAHCSLRRLDGHAGFMDYEPILRDLQKATLRIAAAVRAREGVTNND